MNDNKPKLSFPTAVIISSTYPKPIVEMIDAAIKYEDKRIIYGDEIYNDAVCLMQSSIDLDFDACLQICQEKRTKEHMEEFKRRETDEEELN